MYKLVVLVSGGGTNLQAVISQIADGKLPGIKIAGVLASKPDIGACKRAQDAQLPCAVLSRNDYKNIHEYDRAMLQIIEPWQPDLVVLAGFLSLIGPEVISRYDKRIINIHPSLIPSFCGTGLYGLRVHQAALEYGVKLTGATVHLVDEAYDQGPIVLQKAVDVKPDDTPQTLQQRVMVEAEQQILPEAIRLFASDRISLKGRTVHIREALK